MDFGPRLISASTLGTLTRSVSVSKANLAPAAPNNWGRVPVPPMPDLSRRAATPAARYWRQSTAKRISWNQLHPEARIPSIGSGLIFSFTSANSFPCAPTVCTVIARMPAITPRDRRIGSLYRSAISIFTPTKARITPSPTPCARRRARARNSSRIPACHSVSRRAAHPICKAGPLTAQGPAAIRIEAAASTATCAEAVSAPASGPGNPSDSPYMPAASAGRTNRIRSGPAC